MNEWQTAVDYYLHEPDFWAGVFVTLAFVIPMAWFFGWLGKQWNSMLQFFQPAKRPGKLPMETLPSPFSQLMGCIITGFWVMLGIGGVLVWLYLAMRTFLGL